MSEHFEISSPEIKKPEDNLDKKENLNRLYPERAFSRVDSEIERIRKIENGEIARLELTEDERKEVLEFEDILGEKLENIESIKINTAVFYPEYFLTD